MYVYDQLHIGTILICKAPQFKLIYKLICVILQKFNDHSRSSTLRSVRSCRPEDHETSYCNSVHAVDDHNHCLSVHGQRRCSRQTSASTRRSCGTLRSNRSCKSDCDRKCGGQSSCQYDSDTDCGTMSSRQRTNRHNYTDRQSNSCISECRTSERNRRSSMLHRQSSLPSSKSGRSDNRKVNTNLS